MDNQTSALDEALEPLRKIDQLFVTACEMLDLVTIIKHDMAENGFTKREFSDNLIEHLKIIKSNKPFLEDFIAQFEPGAKNFDAEFQMDQSGVVNWLPLAQAYFVLEDYSRSREIFADVVQRFDINAEFEQRLAEVRVDYATVLRVEGKFSDATKQLLLALTWFDTYYPAGHEETMAVIKALTASTVNLEDAKLKDKVFAKLIDCRTKHDRGVDDYIDSLKLAALVLQSHEDALAQPWIDKLRALVLSRTRGCVGALAERKMIDEARGIAQFSLQLYERLFGEDDEKVGWLRKMT
ncbi:hypothetical protein ACI48D_20085 [Massilia sp. LXY-6]|uniref:hypothetical protein n=1 Tax=Massilia sp. LXY-6 TaxID=3379823 RepID=UPI003EE396F4